MRKLATTILAAVMLLMIAGPAWACHSTIEITGTVCDPGTGHTTISWAATPDTDGQKVTIYARKAGGNYAAIAIIDPSKAGHTTTGVFGWPEDTVQMKAVVEGHGTMETDVLDVPACEVTTTTTSSTTTTTSSTTTTTTSTTSTTTTTVPPSTTTTVPETTATTVAPSTTTTAAETTTTAPETTTTLPDTTTTVVDDTTTTIDVASTTPPPSTTVAPKPVKADPTLPKTGVPLALLAAVGVLLILLGSLTVRATRLNREDQ